MIIILGDGIQILNLSTKQPLEHGSLSWTVFSSIALLAHLSIHHLFFQLYQDEAKLNVNQKFHNNASKWFFARFASLIFHIIKIIVSEIDTSELEPYLVSHFLTISKASIADVLLPSNVSQ